MTLLGEPERVHVQNEESIHSTDIVSIVSSMMHDCYQNVTEPQATELQ